MQGNDRNEFLKHTLAQCRDLLAKSDVSTDEPFGAMVPLVLVKVQGTL